MFSIEYIGNRRNGNKRKKLSCSWQMKQIPHQVKSELKHWKNEYAIEPFEEIPSMCQNHEKMCLLKWGINNRNMERLMGNKGIVHSSASYRMAFRYNRAVYFFDSYYSWSTDRKPRRYFSKENPLLIGLGIQINQSILPIIEKSTHELQIPLVVDLETMVKWLKPGVSISNLLKLVDHASEYLEWETTFITQKVFIPGYKESKLHEFTPYHYNLFSTTTDA